MLGHILPYSMSTNSKISCGTVLHLIFADRLNDKIFFSQGLAQFFYVILLPYLLKKKAILSVQGG